MRQHPGEGGSGAAGAEPVAWAGVSGMAARGRQWPLLRVGRLTAGVFRRVPAGVSLLEEAGSLSPWFGWGRGHSLTVQQGNGIDDLPRAHGPALQQVKFPPQPVPPIGELLLLILAPSEGTKACR